MRCWGVKRARSAVGVVWADRIDARQGALVWPGRTARADSMPCESRRGPSHLLNDVARQCKAPFAVDGLRGAADHDAVLAIEGNTPRLIRAFRAGKEPWFNLGDFF